MPPEITAATDARRGVQTQHTPRPVREAMAFVADVMFIYTYLRVCN